MIYRTTDQRIRRKLDRMQHEDAREALRSTPEIIVKELRARLNAQFPNAAPDQIEAEIERRITNGMKPTTAVMPVSLGIPRDVLAARRAERKKMVAANRQHSR